MILAIEALATLGAAEVHSELALQQVCFDLPVRQSREGIEHAKGMTT